MSETKRMILDPNVAQIDQSLSEAIDALRAADSWLLFTIGEDAEEVQAFSVCTSSAILACAMAMQDVLSAQAKMVAKGLS